MSLTELTDDIDCVRNPRVLSCQPSQIAGVDSLAEWYTDILGGALAVKLGTGYISLKQFPAQDDKVEGEWRVRRNDTDRPVFAVDALI